MGAHEQLAGIDFTELTTREVLEHLPSIEAVPILGHLARLGYERFYENYTIPAPVDDEGLVRPHELVRLVKDLAVPGYKWAAPFFDIDHIYWTEANYIFPSDRSMISELSYSAAEKEIVRVRRKFHDLDENKIGVARQWHNLKELAVRPPAVPDMDVMRREVAASRRKQYLFQYAASAVTIREKLDRSVPIKLNGKMELYDKHDRRVYVDPDRLEERRRNFIRMLLAHHDKGIIDLTELAPLEMVDAASIEDALPIISSTILDTGMMTLHGQRVLKVDIPTEIPLKRAA